MELWRLALFLALGLAFGGNCLAVNRDLTSSLEARSTWNFLGCYVDNVYGRALPHGEAVPGGTNAMTNALCQATCLKAGFSIAGTEYAGECCKSSLYNHWGQALTLFKGAVILSLTVEVWHQMVALDAT